MAFFKEYYFHFWEEAVPHCKTGIRVIRIEDEKKNILNWDKLRFTEFQNKYKKVADRYWLDYHFHEFKVEETE